MDEQEEIRTAAELEAEARERARAEIAGQKSVSAEAPPGQPKVVQHNKPKSKRTLIVSVISLLALAGLAVGGDYLMGMAKGDKSEAKEETKAPKSNGNDTTRERTGMGRDTQPYEGKQDDTETKTAAKQTEQQPQAAPVATFSKVSALAGGGGSSATSRSIGQRSPSSSQPSTPDVAPVDPSSDSSLAQCKKVLVRAENGKLYCPDSATVDTDKQDDGVARITGVKRLNLDPNLYIPVDRHIPCAIMQRFVSDVAGRATCMISEDVYSANNLVRLIPAGSTAIFMYKTGTLKNGMGRMFIAATEIRTPEPNALRIPLINSQAVGQLGENGIAGWIDEHWGERIGNTILVAGVQDFAAGIAKSAPGTDRNTDYTENTRAATAEMAKTILNNSINIPPTMYLNQGDVIGLKTGADIDFSGVYKLHAR